jgi:membrane protein YqaA with SNARE-associated domain
MLRSAASLLHRLSAFLGPLAQNFGGPGLALAAFIDSSSVPLPGIIDLALMGLVVHHQDRWLYYALMTTGGSVAGCFLLYALARKGGEAFVRRRFHERHVERGLSAFRRYGLLTVVVPAILPPPMPFKIFVLLAGVADVPAGTFVLAVCIGRGFRYGLEAVLARVYGEQAQQYVATHVAQVSLWLALAVGIVGTAVVLWRRRAA